MMRRYDRPACASCSFQGGNSGGSGVRLSGSAVTATIFTGFLQPWAGGIIYSLGV